MYLKVNGRMKNFDLLGKSRKQVCHIMERKPDELENDLWCYVVDTSWLKKTVLFIEFEEDKASYLSARVKYRNPLAGSTATNIKHVSKESLWKNLKTVNITIFRDSQNIK